MPFQKPFAEYEPLVHITDPQLLNKLGEGALIGNWFVFLQADWLKRWLPAGIATVTKSAILFRGREELALAGVTIDPTPLPRVTLVSLTSDKLLYRASRDTVRLLIAAPQQPGADLRLTLTLSGNAYAEYPLTLDEYGLCLWSMQDLPEGEYVAILEDTGDAGDADADVCRFEVAEYRLAPLNTEIVEQQLNRETLRYVLSVTAFGQPYTGPIEVELQERGQRIGERVKLRCNSEGKCRGAVQLTGQGPYTLNVFADERSAVVALKGSEQERREPLMISELGEERLLSLMPLLPLSQSNICRGMYISRGAANNEPFLVSRVIGREVEITARADTEMLSVVVVSPVSGKSEETIFEHIKNGQSVHVPIPSPYGMVLLGAWIDGQAWEGWCAVLRPSSLQLQCEAPKSAKPGARIFVTLKTNLADQTVPVQLIVKDQRLIAASDPQVEFAARIKNNIGQWREQSGTGKIERELRQVGPPFFTHYGGGRVSHVRPMVAQATTQPLSASIPPIGAMARGMATPQSTGASMQVQESATVLQTQAQTQAQIQTAPASVATLPKIRLEFPEVVYNTIVKVKGQAVVEVKLGDSMTSYTIEAFALSSETMDWQRVETTLEAIQPVYGELTVSPFVFPGDSVMGRLDVGAASGGAIVEVRHNDDILPLFFDDGSVVTPGLPIPSGIVVRFPVQPGAITATVHDARKGGIDVSERYVTEPGKMRHILRRLHVLTSGDEVTLREDHRLDIKPLPGLERPFQVFVEEASLYPFGCIQQTSCKMLAMYTGYITNRENAEVAGRYESAIVVWYNRLKSMYLPDSGFTLYPPQESGSTTPDTYYAPLAVKNLLLLPDAARSGLHEKALLKILVDIRTMARDAANYYKIAYPPHEVGDCHDAYAVLMGADSSDTDKLKPINFVRSRLIEENGQAHVRMAENQPSYHLWGMGVSTREETAYAAAALLAANDPNLLPLAIAATNYVTGQINAEGRLYSTVDTAAALALLMNLRAAGVVTTGESGRVLLNGQEMKLADALAYDGKVESLRCLEGIIAAQVTSEVLEDWSALQSQLPVTIQLERKGQKGQVQRRFKRGDELDLVIRVSQYEAGLLAHVCLPDALARVVGGGQVKRFSLDFCGHNELRVPLAAVGSTMLPDGKNQEGSLQHWAVIVRNMFKEEQVGNPGLLEVMVE